MAQGGAAARLLQIANEVEFGLPFGLLGTDAKKMTQMKAEAAAIIASQLGHDHHLVTQIAALSVGRHAVEFRATTMGPTVVDEFVGVVRAAINLLDADYARPSSSLPICDPELWDEIKDLVHIEAWSKIPGRVATFVEHWYREHSQVVPTKGDGRAYGETMMRQILQPGSPFALGGQASEAKGWADLGSGFIAAIGNVNRHALLDRDDAEQFAWGVIGLGSLLVGEMRRTHASAVSGF